MPATTTITKAQRDGIYELVCNHLYGIEDLWIAFGRSRDYATAERLGLEFGEDFRLLADRSRKTRQSSLVSKPCMRHGANAKSG